MREIKFRGKATEDCETDIDVVLKGDWVDGHYYYSTERCSGIIVTSLLVECGGVGSGITQAHIPVKGKTVGQYTGLKDKHDNEIYEGDIIKGTTTEYDSIHVVRFLPWTSCFVEIDPPERDKDCPDHWHALFSTEKHEGVRMFDKIIGNIYDNPELLENKP